MKLTDIPTYPFGVHTAQSWQQIASYLDIIYRFDVLLFVEVGVDVGGLALLMLGRAAVTDSFRYVGFDVNTQHVHVQAAPHVRQRDVLTSDTWHELHELIRASAKTLLLCDDGNKPKEVAYLCDLLKAGDLLTVHDYGSEFLEDDVPPFVHENYVRIYDYQPYNVPLWRRL